MLRVTVMKTMHTCWMLGALLAAVPVWAQDEATETAPAAETKEVPANKAASPIQTENFPRYASIKRGEANVRSGPGNAYPILWVYQRVGYPVQLLVKFDNYYKVRDVEGEEGWIYVGMVSAARTTLVEGTQEVAVYRRNTPKSDIIARLSPGVSPQLLECDDEKAMCRIEIEGIKGWVERSKLLWTE